ncbi:hypothetical protein BJV78DRAFT_1196364, partial [Lactifluus subvellereus]
RAPYKNTKRKRRKYSLHRDRLLHDAPIKPLLWHALQVPVVNLVAKHEAVVHGQVDAWVCTGRDVPTRLEHAHTRRPRAPLCRPQPRRRPGFHTLYPYRIC